MMNIGTRLLRMQLLGAALFLSVAALVTSGMHQVSSAIAHTVDDVASASVAMEASDLISETRVAEARVIVRDEPAARALLAETTKRLIQAITSLCRMAEAGPLRVTACAMPPELRGYVDIQQRMLALLDAGRVGEAQRVFAGPLETRYAQFDANFDRLGERYRQHTAGTGRDAQSIASFVLVFVLSFSALGFLLRFMVQIMLHVRMVRPLVDITRSLSALAAGDTSVVLTGGERRDEIGAMVRSLQVFRAQALQIESEHQRTLEAQARAERLSRHDALTGLPNRRFFTEVLERLISDPAQPAAVLMIDLDRFKPVNDLHGHDAGDVVLCALAERFAAHRDELGTVARLGGDEFVVALPTSHDRAHVTRIAQLLGVIIAQPIQIDRITVDVGATIGIAMFPGDGTTAAELLRAADMAMYQAKALGDVRYRFFERSIADTAQARATLHADIRRGVCANEFLPFYQPLVAISDGALVGFEVLARWMHPDCGLVLPDTFIPVADEIGQLTALTYRLLERVCADVQDWPSSLMLSFNLAPSQLRDPLIAPTLIEILDRHGIAPERIEIEITENALITDLAATRAVMAQLQARGIRIALDDFGTGYASLNHLRDYKFDKIKIDRSFLRGLDQGSKNEGIVRAMITLGKSLDLAITAEGVEDMGQWAHLSDWGCDFGQGFLFGPGVPRLSAEAFIKNGVAGTLPQATLSRQACS